MTCPMAVSLFFLSSLTILINGSMYKLVVVVGMELTNSPE